jgi:hypothetical protein
MAMHERQGPDVMTAPGSDDARPLRIVVADDSYLVREALGHLLGTTPELEVVALC